MWLYHSLVSPKLVLKLGFGGRKGHEEFYLGISAVAEPVAMTTNGRVMRDQ